MSNQKQKMAQMVLKKMQQKKQAQQRNRPHFQVLQLQIKFAMQQNQLIKQQIKKTSQKLSQQKYQLNQLKLHLQDLQNTGKKKYPMIIIKPDFIASQNIAIKMKDFYRKCSNTFLKADIIKNQKYQVYINKQKQIQNINDQICQLEDIKAQQIEKNIKILQKKRLKVLKSDLLRRKYIIERNQVQTQMQQLKADNKQLLKQYQLKKQNLQNRIYYNKCLSDKLEQQKIKIQNKYNPVTYRDYLKKIFDIRIKNQYMQKNLVQMITNLNDVKKKQDNYRKELESKCKSIMFYGKLANSPSKSKGKIQKSLKKQELKRYNSNPKNLTQYFIQDKQDAKSLISKSQRKNIHRSSLNNFHFNSVDKISPTKSTHLIKNKSNKKSQPHQYTSLKALKNSIKSQRTMSSTLRTISTAKKSYKFQF